MKLNLRLRVSQCKRRAGDTNTHTHTQTGRHSHTQSTTTASPQKLCLLLARSRSWSSVGRMGGDRVCKKNTTSMLREKLVIQAPGIELVSPWARAQQRTINTRQRTRSSNLPRSHSSSELFIATLWTNMEIHTTCC